MMSPLMKLSRPALVGLASALETERFSFPIYPFALASYVPEQLTGAIASELNQLQQEGMSPVHMAYMLELLAQERAITHQKQDQIDLVWTGPELSGSESRDTAVVVQELFSSAQHSVLVSSFAIDQGNKGRKLFHPLVRQMDLNPNLSVRLFLNIKQNYRNAKPASILLEEFSHNFRQHVWSGCQLPEIFYDPRSLELSTQTNACLHAKCIIIDEEKAFITSANFTEAAHQRNIEAGVLVRDQITARAILSQFEMLVTQGILYRVPGF
ncbi:DISARM system phospholipase D-like protein DrmC [Geitlerinema sp. PCC 7407]|uniref:DISARM system phospholipase D-like protein DrmC n=1 Tax=Geitlerinema sp. PCC 7407 TaxID=1173025 RepID=UPI00029FD2FF|nr:DISARM system phospholipase D-like protein DrmC [Geitlerinema sp. PCC 7407]AFY66693.1 phospholipase D/Transphosphatidylase [Geitlerinema sp. PCC 7407]